MSDLGWRADGIARALAAGGVELEAYRRPGFVGGIGVRRVPFESPGSSGIPVYADPEWQDDEDDRWPASRLRR